MLTVLNMSLTASIVIIFVLMARLVLRKAPKVFSYALWAVVLFRLLCPVSISSNLSLLGMLDRAAAPVTQHTTTVEHISQDAAAILAPNFTPSTPNIDSGATDQITQQPAATPPNSGVTGHVVPSAEQTLSTADIARVVWLTGIGVMLLGSAVSLFRLRRKLIGAVRLCDNIYLADHIDTPFVMGLLRARIYLPSSLSEHEQRYILLHEQQHIRRMDHIAKALAFLALCIHWFNPLVWLAFVLSVKDMEMSCDEAVMRKMGAEIRTEYSASLLSFATGRRIIAGTPLAFGEGDTKKRIKNVLNWKQPKAWIILAAAAVCIAVVIFCAGNPAGKSFFKDVTPIEDSYELTAKNQVYTRPAMTIEDRRMDSLTLTLDDGFYFCLTTDEEKATEFINAQRTLLQFLSDSGVETRKLRYYAVDYDDSFSDSENNKAYIALSHVKSYQQVLVTLQTLLGDYMDYGYAYSVANAIAAHLGWQTETIEDVEQSVLDSFFTENPDALNLLYPCFTTTYATEETARNCKVLSRVLAEEMDLSEALTKPIEEQVNAFRALADAYAQKISVTFSRQAHGYAYSGENLPLKILTTYALHIVDRNYKEENYDYFSNYQAIFATADQLNEEISAAVARFDLEDSAGVIKLNWLSEESALKKSGRPFLNNYYNTSHEVTTMSVQLYLHGYYFHLQSLLNPNLGDIWQKQAFCQMGLAHSQYPQEAWEKSFTQDERFAKLFFECTGRTYQPGIDDLYEAYDILCYIYSEYDFDFLYGRNGTYSFSNYLIDLYGEDTVFQLMLFPDTMESVTGKTWDEQKDDWLAYMEEKFAGVEIPEWISEFQ